MTTEEIREGVVESLPLIMEIQDKDLRDKVIEAWTLALTKNGMEHIEDMPGSGKVNYYTIGNQAQHILCVTRMALSLVDIIQSTYNKDLELSRDMILAAGLCHDVGKPYEFSPEHQAEWTEHPERWGKPALRHTLYGVYIALTAGLPEEIVHVCGCHSPEGDLVQRSLLATIIYYCDKASWRIPGCYDHYVFPNN